MDDDISDLTELFDRPQEPHSVSTKKPNRCGVCGSRTKRLYPQQIGKTTFYICKFCRDLTRKEKDDERNG